MALPTTATLEFDDEEREYSIVVGEEAGELADYGEPAFLEMEDGTLLMAHILEAERSENPTDGMIEFSLTACEGLEPEVYALTKIPTEIEEANDEEDEDAASAATD
jgi:hypothetical protein